MTHDLAEISRKVPLSLEGFATFLATFLELGIGSAYTT
jgi:hypothetical protein